jgi:hypothetical protein
VAFTVVYDACVLYPIALRDLFIRLAQTGLFRAKWTDRILNECFDSLLKERPDVRSSLERQRILMADAIPDVAVRDYARLIPVVPPLPDPDDSHVVAAAMASGAEVIVTFNLKDFPANVVGRLGIEAQHPDTFLSHVIDLDRPAVERVIRTMAEIRKQPPMTFDEVLERLRQLGLVESVKALRGALA